MKKLGGDLICMRPDSIVEARFKLTKKQNDIMDMVFANIKDDENLEYEIDVSKYARLYNLKDKSDIYGEFKKAVRTFEGKGFAITEKISEKKEHRIYFSWFSSIEYVDGEGKIKFELGQKLKTLLLEVKRVVFYNIEYSINFNCIYSKRLYYYLKLFEDTKIRIDNLTLLREKLECPESYKKYSNFRRFVLEPAFEEINGNSDINFEFEEVKTKNKVTSIKFYIKSNKKKNDQKQKQVENELLADKETPLDLIEDDIKLIMDITNNEFNEKTVMLFRDLSNNDIKKIKKLYNYMNTKNVQENRVGYMRTLLTQWEDPKTSSSNTGFNNFEPRSLEERYIELRNKMLSGLATEKEEEEFDRLKSER